jgi:hypothetical protein
MWGFTSDELLKERYPLSEGRGLVPLEGLKWQGRYCLHTWCTRPKTYYTTAVLPYCYYCFCYYYYYR